MTQFLTLEFSDNIDIEEALGHTPHGNPAQLAAMLGGDVAELIELQRLKRVQVSDVLAPLLLSLIAAGARMPADTKVFVDMDGDPTLASLDYEPLYPPNSSRPHRLQGSPGFRYRSFFFQALSPAHASDDGLSALLQERTITI